MNSSSDQPLYIIPPGHPLIKQWKPWFERFEKSDDDFVFLAEPSHIQSGYVDTVKGMVMALQHFPHLIEKMVFAVRFDFQLMDGMNISLSEDWKKDPVFRQWLFKLADMPQILFFIKDSPSRFFMIADDILSKQNVTPQYMETQWPLITGRFFTSCLLFFIYCHNTGFQPDTYVDALIAEHEMQFTVQDVKTAYQEVVKSGFDWKNPFKSS